MSPTILLGMIRHPTHDAAHTAGQRCTESAMRLSHPTLLADKSLLSQHNEDDANSPEYYVRHLGDSVVLTTLSGIHDKKNGAWYVAPPLCQPGQGVCPAKPSGAASCFSLESADHAGHYLGKAPTSDLVEMRKFPFADLQHATFCAVAAAGGKKSYAALGKPGFFLTHLNFKMKLCNNKPGTECGVQKAFTKMISFDEQGSKYFGRCGSAKSCQCIKNYVGKGCNLECPGGCGDGKCSAKPNGKAGEEAYCKCSPGFTGPQCKNACPQNAVTKMSCGSVGPAACYFDNTSKKAACKCGVGFRGDACQHHCPLYNEAAKTVCSGKGSCSLASTAKVGGRATKCSCKIGFVGAGCQLPCATNKKGNVCSGKGQGYCEVDAEKHVAKCRCQDGFSGAVCDRVCPRDTSKSQAVCGGNGKCKDGKCACDAGFTGKACSVACPGMLAGSACSGKGKCYFDPKAKFDVTLPKKAAPAPKKATPAAKKKAAPKKAAPKKAAPAAKKKAAPKKAGRRLLADATPKKKGAKKAAPKKKAAAVAAVYKKGNGAMCKCAHGYGGNGCAKKCLLDGNGQVCGGHGTCNMADGKCMCRKGYVGPACTAECPGITPCEGNGKCEFNPKNKAAVCKCKTGFLGRSCSFACPRDGKDVRICSGRGKCGMDKGVASCACQAGFKGKACHHQCPGYNVGKVCNGNGACSASSDDTKAECACNKGFLGAGCRKQCPGLQEDGTVCSGRGKCSATKNGATCACKKGFLGAGCNVMCPQDQFGNICAGAGKCKLTKNKDGLESAKCVCAPGRVNYNCDTSCPSNTADGTVCSGHGSCDIKQKTDTYGNVALSAVCNCKKNYLGVDCFHGCPTAKGNANACSGHGSCKLQGGGAVCKCTPGYSGKDCNERVCGSQNSFFNPKISKCNCELGFTCCSKEGSAEERERDAELEMLTRENALLMAKVRMAKVELAKAE